MFWVSVTGLEVKSISYYPRFMWHAVSSLTQAQSADGNISASTRHVAGIEHTLTVWKSRDHMLVYLREGAHLKAMKASRDLGSYGKVYGYESSEIPTWDEALSLWQTHGRVMIGKPRSGDQQFKGSCTELNVS